MQSHRLRFYSLSGNLTKPVVILTLGFLVRKMKVIATLLCGKYLAHGCGHHRWRSLLAIISKTFYITDPQRRMNQLRSNIVEVFTPEKEV